MECIQYCVIRLNKIKWSLLTGRIHELQCKQEKGNLWKTLQLYEKFSLINLSFSMIVKKINNIICVISSLENNHGREKQEADIFIMLTRK